MRNFTGVSDSNAAASLQSKLGNRSNSRGSVGTSLGGYSSDALSNGGKFSKDEIVPPSSAGGVEDLNTWLKIESVQKY